MKLEELTEATAEYDTILRNILKIVAHTNKTGNLPFGRIPFTIGGKNMGTQPIENNNSILSKLGAVGRYHAGTVAHPLSNEMGQAVQTFIEVMTSGSNKSMTIKDVKPLADKIYKWSKAVQDEGIND